MKTVKYLAISCALLLGAGHNATAQDVAPATVEVKADNPNAAEITFENETHDYGTIKQGADGTCEFKFKKYRQRTFDYFKCQRKLRMHRSNMA